MIKAFCKEFGGTGLALVMLTFVCLPVALAVTPWLWIAVVMLGMISLIGSLFSYVVARDRIEDTPDPIALMVAEKRRIRADEAAKWDRSFLEAFPASEQPSGLVEYPFSYPCIKPAVAPPGVEPVQWAMLPPDGRELFHVHYPRGLYPGDVFLWRSLKYGTLHLDYWTKP